MAALVVVTVIVCDLVVGAAGMPKPLHPLWSRGGRAWAGALERPASGRVSGGVNRLQVHAVDDRTNDIYTAAVRELLIQMRYERVPFTTLEERDRAMADYLSDFCYLRGGSLARAGHLVSGFTHIFPEHKQHMPETARALLTWHRLGLSAEGGPLSSKTIGAIVLKMIQNGHTFSALAVMLSEDAYLREQDWSQMCMEDVYGDQNRVAIVLGVRERGEKARTGSNQGVLLDRAYLGDMILAMKEHLEVGEPFFPISTVEYRRHWWRP